MFVAYPGNPMKNKMLVGLIALALVGSVAALRAEEAKRDAAPAATPRYTVSCSAPCTFTVSGNDKAELIAKVKAHAKTAHKMDMSDKDAEAMIKDNTAPKKS